MAGGNTINRYKQWLNSMEEESPGMKANFLFGFMDRAQPAFEAFRTQVDLESCVRCGQPTTSDVCAFCRLRDQTLVRIAGREET